MELNVQELISEDAFYVGSEEGAEKGNITIVEMLLSSMLLNAESVAVVTAGKNFSYGELDKRSTQIAEVLALHGIKRGAVVGVLLDRGFDFIAAVVGIIRSGCTYLPLDTSYPSDRLSFMVSDADAKLVLSNSELSAQADRFDVPIALIDVIPANKIKYFDHPIQHAAAVGSQKQNSAIYIIYTSGTTGKPKGVPIYSDGLINFIFSQTSYLDINKRSRLIQNSSICFDMSVWEIFLSLSVGASIAIVDNATRQDGRAFVKALDELRISHILLTPSMLSVMPYQVLKSLECIVSAGEKCAQALIDQWAPGRKFYDAYGATEATVYTTIGQCFSGQSERNVGHAMENTAVYILDRDLRKMPAGEVGDIYIGGSGVSSGYLNRESLTRERFLPSPYGNLYKTGDLGTLTPDGALVYKGRIDNQVKINGFRIELEEIEAAANGDCRVMASYATVLTVGEKNNQNSVLVLYVVYTESGRLSVRDMKAILAKSLPRYMLPSLIIELKSFPLTGSGKVNVKELPIPDTRSHSMLRTNSEPQGMLEYKLSNIWANILGHESFTLKDSFFDVGGHSLLANQMFSAIEKDLNVVMPVSTIFTHDSIVSLSHSIRSQQGDHHFSPLVKLRDGDPSSVLYCIHPGGGSLFCYHDLIRRLAANWTVFGIQSANCDFASPFIHRSIEQMAASYVEHILDSDAPKSVTLLGWSSGGLIAFEMARIFSGMGITVNFLGMVDSYVSGDYVEGIDLKDKPGFVFRVIHGRLLDPLPESMRKRIEGLSEDAAIRLIYDDAQSQDIVPSVVSLDRVLRSVDMHRENCLASRAYQPQALQVPVTIYRAMQNADAGTNRLMGWDQALPHDQQLVELDADHYSIISARHVDAIANSIEATKNH